MNESKVIEEIDLRKLNISLDSIDSICGQVCDYDCSESAESSSHSQYDLEHRESICEDIDKLEISLDSIDLDPNTLKDITVLTAETRTPISKGILESENVSICRA